MMKFSTKARYGLRMMVELARELKKDKLVQLGKIAKITGLSENYLAQLAIPLKNNGILLGISGKNGGYRLAKPSDQIKIGEIIRAVGGPVSLTDCVANPEICMNSSFCETAFARRLLGSTRFARFEDDEADGYFDNFEILLKEIRSIDKLFEGRRIKKALIQYIARKS